MLNELLTENDIFNYLMTSEFDEGLTQEEAKFLLLKYRSFYRVLYSKYDQLKTTHDDRPIIIEKLKQEILDLEQQLQKSKDDLSDEKVRKLTWKERFFGEKIIKN